MKVEATITPQYGETVGELLAALSEVPAHATYRIKSHSGDRFSSDWHTITFTWDTAKT